MTPIIYQLMSPSGKVYIGASCNAAERRRTHMRHARKGKAVNKRLQAEWDAFGELQFSEVACALSRSTLHELETDVIQDRNPELNVVRAPTPIPKPGTGTPRPVGRFSSLKDAARELGVTYRMAKYYAAHDADNFECRVERAKQPTEPKTKTYDHPIRPDGLIVVGGRVDFPREHRRRLGIGRDLYYNRKRSGLSQEQALELGPYTPPAPKKKDPPTVKSTPKRAIADRARALGIAPNLVHQRLFKGWPEDQAFGLVPRPKQPRPERPRKPPPAPKVPQYEAYGHKGGLAKVLRANGLNDKGIIFARNRVQRGQSLESIIDEVRAFFPGHLK